MKDKPHVRRVHGAWRCFGGYSKGFLSVLGDSPCGAYNAWALEVLAQREREYRERSAQK